VAEIIRYIIESFFCLVIFYFFYYIFLRKENHPSFIRIYLLASFIISFIFPLIDITSWLIPKDSVIYAYTLPSFIVGNADTGSSPSIDSGSYLQVSILTILYFLVSTSLFISILLEFRKILILLKSEEKTSFKGCIVILHKRGLPTFSFMKVIFLSTEDTKNIIDKENILNHELAHIKGLHSLDIIFMEVIKIIFWFNPLVYAYKNALMMSHEYIADKQSISKGNDQSYVNLLVNQTLSNLGLSLGSHFGRKSGILPSWLLFGHLPNNKSIILKRIKMIKNKKKMNKAKFMVPVLAILVSFSVVSCLQEDDLVSTETEEIDKEKVTEIDVQKDGTVTITSKNGKTMEISQDELNHHYVLNSSKNKDNVFTIVEQRPLYNGGDEAFYEYLSQKIVYPKEAYLSNFKVLKGIGFGTEKEALKVIKNMPDWIPGKQANKNVKVQMVLPILFKLEP